MHVWFLPSVSIWSGLEELASDRVWRGACCHCPWRSGQGRLLHNLVQLRSAATSSTFSGTRTPAGPPAQSCPPRWSSLPASRVDQHQLIWVEMYLHLTYLKTFLVRQDNRH
jgi:hypothetical protein